MANHKPRPGFGLGRTYAVRGKSSQYRGVRFRADKMRPWVAEISGRGRDLRHIGYFATEVDAALAFDRAAVIAGRPEACNFPAENAREGFLPGDVKGTVKGA